MGFSYFILTSRPPENLPIGCIFKYDDIEKKMICMDNGHQLNRPQIKIDHSKPIDQRSAFLLLGVISCKDRLSMLNAPSWNQKTELDVGDVCLYNLSGQTVKGIIISKHFKDKHAFEFTIQLSNDRKINASIEKIEIDDNVPKPAPIPKTNVPKPAPIPKTEVEKPKLKKEFKLVQTDPMKFDDLIMDRFIQKLNVYPDPKTLNQDQLKDKRKFFQEFIANFISILKKEEVIKNTDSTFTDPFLFTYKDCQTNRNFLHLLCYYLLYDQAAVIIYNLSTDKLDQLIDIEDSNGDTPLLLCLKSPYTNSELSSDTNLKKIFKLLIMRNADVNRSNNENETPVTYLIKKADMSLFECLLNNTIQNVHITKHCTNISMESLINTFISNNRMDLLKNFINLWKVKNEKDAEFYVNYIIKFLEFKKSELAVDIFNKYLEYFKDNNLTPTFLIKSKNESLLSCLLKCKKLTNQIIWKFLLDTNFKLIHQSNECGKLACQRLFYGFLVIISNEIQYSPMYSQSYVLECLKETIETVTKYFNNKIDEKDSIDISVTKMLEPDPVEETAKNIWTYLISKNFNSQCAILNGNDPIWNLINSWPDENLKRFFAEQIMNIKNSPPINQNNFDPTCSICMDEPINCAFKCGHTCCFNCANQITLCHVCREKIIEIKKIFI